MKRTHLMLASMLLAFTGCSCGQGWNCGRLNIFSRLHDHIHGSNVGAPCQGTGCATPAAAPVMADAGCENCSGVQTMGYDGYSAYAGEVVGSEVVGSTYGGVVRSPAQGEIVPSVRAN